MRKRKQKGTPDAQDAAALEGEQALADGGAPLLVHLQALRRVLIVSAAAVAIAFFLVYSFAIDYLMAWITGPIAARGIEIIYTAMSEALVTKFKVALIAGLVIAAPVIIWQVWGFIKPALYPKEKKTFRTLFVIALLLFLLGVAFCYLAVYTLAVDFFLVAGVAFQLPVALYLTTRMGLTNAKMLASKRKFVILGIFVLAAVLTPPDVVSQLALGLPMILLYEIGILACRLTKPKERE